MHCILFNGPPGVGKDTAADLVTSIARRELSFTNVEDVKFAEPLKAAVHALLGMPGRAHDYFEHGKDRVLEEFMGKTPRQCYIAMSEEFAKKFWDHEFFGMVMAGRLEHHYENAYSLVAISDSGFAGETIPVLRASTAEDQFLIVQMHRNGCTFKGDSRGWLERDELVKSCSTEQDGEPHWAKRLSQITIQNNGSMEELQQVLREKVNAWIDYTATASS